MIYLASSGARYQVIVLKINKNGDDAVKELLEAQKYLDTHFGERFKVKASFYARKNNLLPRITNFFLVNGFIDNPLKTLYQISKQFMNNTNVNFFQVSALGWVKGIEELGYALKESGDLNGNPKPKQ